MVNAIRPMTQIAGIQPVPGARIIIVEGSAKQVAIAEKLAAEIDRNKRRFRGLGYWIDPQSPRVGS